MKILLTGGGSGGHFYPLIAVAEEINKIIKEEKLLPAQIYFMSDTPYDSEALLQNNIIFIKNTSGKVRRYFSLLNIIDTFKIAFGMFSSLIKVFNLYPDVIFSKGAYASFPILWSAKILKIPVVIHESDSVPGRTNAWSAKFAKRIAVSYPETVEYFDKSKVAYTGNPVRKEVILPSIGGHEFFNLDKNIPTILILGGSLGAKLINDQIVAVLKSLVEKYQIIHQTGKNNIEEIVKMSEVVLADSPHKDRYRAFDYLDDLNLSMSAGIANLIISRAGSTIFEIANWGKPSIIIPITDSNGDHQRKNAYNYARSGGAIVIEESNLTPNILLAEIDRLISNKETLVKMSVGAKTFVKENAANTIAREIIQLSLKHEE